MKKDDEERICSCLRGVERVVSVDGISEAPGRALWEIDKDLPLEQLKNCRNWILLIYEWQ